MAKYLIDGSNMIIEKLDDATPINATVKEGNYVLTDLRLTHSFDDYFCWKYQYVDIDNYNTNTIILYAIDDASNNVVDIQTTDMITNPTGITLTETQAAALFDDKGVPSFEVVAGAVLSRSAADKLQEQKDNKKIALKREYMEDVLWTDNAKVFYDKWKDRYPSNTDHDTWFEDVMTYWKEARTERDANKTSVDDAIDEAGVDAVTFTPTHVKSRSTIEQ